MNARSASVAEKTVAGLLPTNLQMMNLSDIIRSGCFFRDANLLFVSNAWWFTRRWRFYVHDCGQPL